VALKSVLILTASFGEGHNAAARNLRESLLSVSPESNVVVSDVFLEAYGWLNRLSMHGYLAIINHMPWLWQGIFDLLDRTTVVEMHMGFYGAAERRLTDLIETNRPDVIVSVYPGCNFLLDRLYPRGKTRSFSTLTIVTDSLTINSVWYRPHSDMLLVANEETAQEMQKAGVSDEKILVTGFPVPRRFAQMQKTDEPPATDEPWRVLYVINSGQHLAPGIVRQLLDIPGIALTATVGKNEELGKRLAQVAAEKGRPLEIHGWTQELPRLMAESHLLISKAGGATVQESLAALTPMIITQIVPGQEEGNARLLIENGAGIFASSADEIATAVREIIQTDGALWRQQIEAVRALSRPEAADQIAQFVLSQTVSEDSLEKLS
jgi:processive 1,2-diacylglycerol beta-glucosyltransferase